jgi:hypothetical protein
MVLHTTPTLRNSYIDILKDKFPSISKKQFSALATDRLLYLSNLVSDSEPNAKSEVYRVLGIKAQFNFVNDDKKYMFEDKNSIKTHFVE